MGVRTATLLEWIEGARNEEPIEAVVLGDGGYLDAAAPRDVLLSLEEAIPWLTESFEAGYGVAGCPPFYAWTATRVLMVSEYDGATNITWVPRNPAPGAPGYH